MNNKKKLFQNPKKPNKKPWVVGLAILNFKNNVMYKLRGCRYAFCGFQGL